MSRPAVPVVPAVGPPQDREPEVGARRCRHHGLHGVIVRVAHPDRSGLGVLEQPRLVAVVLLERAVPVEVVWGEVGEHADGGAKVRNVVELKRAQLEREPVRRIRRERDVAQRPADVARRLGPQAGRHHRVRDERRRGGLPVGAGDPDASRSRPQRQEPDIHFGVHLQARLAGPGQRRDVRRHAGRHHDRRRARDALEVVPAELYVGAEPGQLRRPTARTPGRCPCPTRTPAGSRGGAASSRPRRSCRAPPRRLRARSRASVLNSSTATLSAPSAWRARPAHTAVPGCRSASPPSSRPSRASRSGGAAAPSGTPGGRRRTPGRACA